MIWNEMELFTGIDLNDSFVLNWKFGQHNILIELEASVWPESKHYAKPKTHEYTCYRKAIIEIVNAKSIEGMIVQKQVEPTLDPDGSVDYGNIDLLSFDNGRFQLEGEFGNVIVVGGDLKFKIVNEL